MVRLALSYSAGRKQRFQLLAEGLPAGILVAAGDRIGENRQGDRPEAGEAGERLFLLRRGRPLFLLDGLEGADGGEDVAGFGFFAAGDGTGDGGWVFRRVSRWVGRVDGFGGAADWLAAVCASVPVVPARRRPGLSEGSQTASAGFVTPLAARRVTADERHCCVEGKRFVLVRMETRRANDPPVP